MTRVNPETEAVKVVVTNDEWFKTLRRMRRTRRGGRTFFHD